MALRFIDEKGRVFGKVNLFDLVIILVLIAAGVWFAYAKFSMDLAQNLAAREQPIEFTIRVSPVLPTTAEPLREGDKVFEFKTGSCIGTIAGVKTAPAEVWTVNEDGKWLLTKDSGRVDVYITVRGTARVGENTITVNGVEIRVGLSIGVMTKWVQVTGNVLTMSLEEGTPR